MHRLLGCADSCTERILTKENIKKLDKDIQLPIMDVNVRQTIGKTSYGDIWDESNLETKFDPSKCVTCKICTAEPVCPMKGITSEGDQVKRDNERCFNCGLCTTQCVGGAFQGSLGAINFDGRKIPVILRQSDRARRSDWPRNSSVKS